MSDTCSHLDTVADVAPSSEGCEDCLRTGGQWVHLRMCLSCGHIGCCDSSPGQHATGHAEATGHPVIMSFEPGEDWFYDYTTKGMIEGAELAAPHAHPKSQPAPGPKGRVPKDWESLLH